MPSEVHAMMTPQDAAAHLGLSVGRLAKMRLTGDTPPFAKIGASVRYRRDDLDAWLASRMRKSTSDQG
jgi:predicted DNA-binding transcriptional regulator AlpA